MTMDDAVAGPVDSMQSGRAQAPVPDDAAVLEIERVAALGWPGLEQAWIDGWLLRAGGGWTGRANSALPLRDTDDVDGTLARVAAWYAARRLPPLVQVPLPTRARLRSDLSARGWVDRWGAIVLTARIDDVLHALDVRVGTTAHRRQPAMQPDVEIAAVPDEAWLATYHHRGGSLPAVAPQVLQAGTSPRFLSIVDAGETVAVGRSAVAEGWVGITAVEVAEAHRGRGLARRLLAAALYDATLAGATYAYLQTTAGNAPALRLYTSAGFAEHHRYRNHGPVV